MYVCVKGYSYRIWNEMDASVPSLPPTPPCPREQGHVRFPFRIYLSKSGKLLVGLDAWTSLREAERFWSEVA